MAGCTWCEALLPAALPRCADERLRRLPALGATGSVGGAAEGDQGSAEVIENLKKKFDKTQLKQFCENRGLVKRGNMLELIQRLLGFNANPETVCFVLQASRAVNHERFLTLLFLQCGGKAKQRRAPRPRPRAVEKRVDSVDESVLKDFNIDPSTLEDDLEALPDLVGLLRAGVKKLDLRKMVSLGLIFSICRPLCRSNA